MRSRFSPGLESLVDSFRTHKLTAALSTMGVAIGSASLVLVVTAGRAGQQYVIEQIEGVGSNLVYAEHVNGGGIAKIFGAYDRGFPLRLGHSSIWSRSAAGFSPQRAGNPFANFYFGGFGNNWIDHLDEKRYREYYGLPGADLNEIGGRNFLKTGVEWNAPPLRFRRAGIPAFYATWARPAVFAHTLATNVDASDRRRVVSDVGGQIDVRFGALSALELTASFGAAAAFERGVDPRRELFASLKILR